MTDTRPSLSAALSAATSQAGRAITLLEMKAMTQSFVMALAGLRFKNALPVGEDIVLREGIEKLIISWENARVERTAGPSSTYDPLAEFTTMVATEAGFIGNLLKDKTP
jgi:hypothetical protein